MNSAAFLFPSCCLLLAACGSGAEGAFPPTGSAVAAAGSVPSPVEAVPVQAPGTAARTEAAAPQDGAEAAADAMDDGAPLQATPPPGPDLPPPDENGAITINWDDLLPEGEMERLEQIYNSAYSTTEMNHFGGQMPQLGTFNTREALLGQTIRMPGFILPLDYQPGGDIEEFLLVPYFGACIHTPPPPPNQIVYVTMDEPLRVDRLWAPVWVTGVLSADRHTNDLGDAAYTMHLTGHEPYER